MAFLKNLNVDKLKERATAGAKRAQEELSKIDVEGAVQKAKDGVASFDAEAAVQKAKDSITNFDMDAAVQSAKDAVASGVAKAEEAVEQYRAKDAEYEPDYRDFIALLWCLAAADGVVTTAEHDKITEIGTCLDEGYSEYADELEGECRARLDAAAGEFGAQNAAKIEAQRLVEGSEPTPRDGKLMCWNLLAVASADGTTPEELDFIRFVGQKAGVDRAALEELCNYSAALVEVEAAREQLRGSGRSYNEIEPLVNELAQREQVIVDAAQALVTDR